LPGPVHAALGTSKGVSMARSLTVEVATYPSKTEADFAASILQTNEIEVFVQAGGTGGEQVGAPTISGFVVFVAADDADAAREVLSGVYPEDKLTYKSAYERRKERTVQVSPVATFIIGIFVGGLLVGAALTVQNHRNTHFTGTRFSGNILEKQPGILDDYQSGQLVRRQIDRNLDGKLDVTIIYSDHQLQSTAYDQNFDGKPDLWQIFKGGNPTEERIDSDFNGVADEFSAFKNGVRTRMECRPNDASRPTAIILFENGVQVSKLDEPDGSGVLRREVTYDAFGKEIAIRKTKAGA
jgi:hypothetical protein